MDPMKWMPGVLIFALVIALVGGVFAFLAYFKHPHSAVRTRAGVALRVPAGKIISHDVPLLHAGRHTAAKAYSIMGNQWATLGTVSYASLFGASAGLSIVVHPIHAIQVTVPIAPLQTNLCTPLPVTTSGTSLPESMKLTATLRIVSGTTTLAQASTLWDNSGWYSLCTQDMGGEAGSMVPTFSFAQLMGTLPATAPAGNVTVQCRVIGWTEQSTARYTVEYMCGTVTVVNSASTCS